MCNAEFVDTAKIIIMIFSTIGVGVMVMVACIISGMLILTVSYWCTRLYDWLTKW
jgi:hypothetical protein